MSSYLTDLTNKIGLSDTSSSKTTGGYQHIFGGRKKMRKRQTKRQTKRKKGGNVLSQASVPFGLIGLQRMVGKNMSKTRSKRRNRSFRRN